MFGKESRVHAVGDGADWIALQVDERFGSQGSYLVDFYHVCDYLSAAAAAIHAGAEAAKAWFDQQKERLKAGSCAEAIESLRAHIEADEVPDSEAAVRSCYRYLNRRKNQLDYPGALANGKPLAQGKSRARIAISCRNGSNFRGRGGAPQTLSTCWPCA